MIPLLLGFLLSANAHAATIVHTNDVMGELEPCGCRSNPQGGIARKANLLARIAQTQDHSILQLDAGDLLFPTDTIPELLTAQSELQASYLLKAHEKLGQDAVVPGEKDFALGLKVFEKLRKGSKIRFLAANLKRKNGKAALEPHAVFTRKEGDKTVRIGVVGLVGEDLLWPQELNATSAIAAAKAEARALRKSVDVLIALTHEGYDKDVALAKAVPQFDLIIGGHTQTFLQKPSHMGSTWIYQSSFRNQYVGLIPLATRDTPETYKLIGLDAGYDSPADKPGETDLLVKEFKAAVADLNSRQESKIATAASGNQDPNSPKFQTFTRCAECHLKQFDFWRKTRHATAFHSLVGKQQSKNKDCLSCHTVGLGDAKGFEDANHLFELSGPLSATGDVDGEQQQSWLSHEQTDSVLQAVHRARSLKDKIQLPTKAEPLTVRQAIATVNHAWTPVQCENCHGPGHDHPFGTPIAKKIENTTCLKCHTADRAPEWYKSNGQPDWEKVQGKRSLVTCPAGELTPEESPE